ncbi:MAG: patatin-like phospholipase family protein [Proteiniclasticum sp.]|uniref:patatin-like phospholipase family protein n=1 Tax=Proteiniclasticum ruminis TaxID=398199 RepID=UPI001B6978FA|nr:patatin-like phospholipase family protein [Proteiniclasticum ruminis]MBP9921002.1 patatin-like phospholipase family protein [Proteiniclasticum sp.]
MYGLALGGGGSRGSYEIGVLKALQELNIEIGAITGTSIGAINGAAYLMNDFALMEEIWMSLNRDSLIKFESQIVPEVIRQRGFDFEILLSLLHEILDEETIRNHPTDLGIVTYNLTARKPVVLFKEEIPQGKLIDYVAASANHPSFQRLRIDGDAYIDGAVYDNIPVRPLYDKGYTEIIAVNLHTFGDRRNLSGPYQLIEIESNNPLGSILFPDPETIRNNMTYGYLDTLRAFKKLYGATHYFERLDDFALLSSLNAEEVKNLKETIHPFFLNKTLEKYQKLLFTDYSLTQAALEITAEALEISSLKVYRHQGELLDAIFSKIQEIVQGEDKISWKERAIFKELDPTALTALAVTSPKLAIANLFIKMIQNRILGGS